jgi:hypothetical protein
MKRWIVLSVFVSLVVVVLALVRTKREFVAECSVTVTGKDSQALANMRVSEIWNAYSYDLSGGQEVLSDAHGKVIFPSQSATHSLLFWYLSPILTRLNYGVHASSGTSASFGFSQPGFEAREGDTLGFTCSDRECTDHPLEFKIHLTEVAAPRR